MTDTNNLALPLIEASQAQKHVTHNEALRILDAAIQIAVLDLDRTAPPSGPAEGDRHIVAAGSTGAWAGKAAKVAIWQDGAWAFLTPMAGWLAWSIANTALMLFDGTAWQDIRAMPLDNLTRLGINTSASSPNLLAVRTNAALLSAINVADAGSGDVRLQLSKESSSKTASLVFSDAFSGCAEFGLAGDDDFHVKVSADGSTWTEAIRIARGTGKVSFPANGGAREMLTTNRTYYVRPDGSDANTGLSNSSAGAFLTIQKAIDVVFGTLDLGGFNVTIQLADATYTTGFAAMSPQVGAGLVTVQGNASSPGNVVISTTAQHAVWVANMATVQVKDFEIRVATSGWGLFAELGGVLSYANMQFGSCATSHIRASDGGRVTCVGNYAIVGSAGVAHWDAVAGAINCRGFTVTLTGTPSFTSFARSLINGVAFVNGNTFIGTATGGRYDVRINGVFYTGGASTSYLPGDVAGSVTTGGQYA